MVCHGHGGFANAPANIKLYDWLSFSWDIQGSKQATKQASKQASNQTTKQVL